MCDLLIFGGTTEGRLLAEYCHDNGIEAFVSVVSGYGVEMLPESRFLHVSAGRLTEEEMADFIREKGITTVLDATHPYAFAATENIKEACGRQGTCYYRVVREESAGAQEGKPGEQPWVFVSSAEEAASFLAETKGRIFVTTGSSRLSAYSVLEGFADRVYARVLPTGDAISICEDLGLLGSHTIAMQGPFSEELNRAMMEQLHIRYLVTKETGGAGGFMEKLAAARSLSVTTVIIGRPASEQGLSVDEAKRILYGMGKGQRPVDGGNSIGEDKGESLRKRVISLIGAGMGGLGQMTVMAAESLKCSDVVFGAGRLMVTAKIQAPKAALIPEFESERILTWLRCHPDFKRPAVLYSGDTGFYSGASGMASLTLENGYREQFEVRMLPGISSVSYLCAKVNRSWEHVRLLSLHGRAANVIKALLEDCQVFVLLGGENTVGVLCRELCENGLSCVTVIVGERLSYSDERIVTGTPKQIGAMEFDSLAAALIVRDKDTADVSVR